MWLRGHWSSLFVAVGFSLVLNLALVSTFIWPALLGPELKLLIWPAVAICWLIFGWISWRYLDQFEKIPETPGKTDDTLFIQAQTEYLKGDNTQAELLLAQQLQADSRDAEARLLLVSIYRRTDRVQKALQQLDKLRRLDTGIRWQFEIEREQRLIDQAAATGRQMDDPDNPNTEDETLQEEDSSDSRHSGTIQLGEASVIRETVHEDKQITNSTFHPRAA